MIDWPDLLIESLARRRAVLFLGAGISANAKDQHGKKPATWGQFLANILKSEEIDTDKIKEIQELLDSKNYLMACELIVMAIGLHQFGEAVQNEFRRPGYQPAEIHKIIYGLDSRLVITTNVDKIYDECAMAESHSSVVIKKYYDSDIAKYLRLKDYLVIKAHGTVDETDKMIFTHKQYSEARCKYGAFYRLLDSLILTHTFIFLGCGINDPDIQLILENANFMYEGCQPHYFLTADNEISDSVKEVLLSNRNIKVITYANDNGDYSRLLDEVYLLKNKVEEKRQEVVNYCDW